MKKMRWGDEKKKEWNDEKEKNFYQNGEEEEKRWRLEMMNDDQVK